MNEATEINLRKLLHVPLEMGEPCDELSIMQYSVICEHDDGIMCECRLNYLINFSKEINS